MINELGHFVLVAEHGTFTEAARRAHLSQPALTASMRRLEEQFEARLFDRGRTGASLTAAGEALLPRARAALAAVADGKRAVAEVTGLHAGDVRIGAGATACTYLLPPLLARFRKAHPNIRFVLREATPGEALAWLEAGDIDLAIVASDRGERFMRDELVLVGAKNVDARTAPFVTFRQGASSRALLDKVFPGAPVAMELSGIAAVKGNVRAGIGIALISRAAVENDLATKRLVEIPHPKTPVPRTLRILHRGIDRLPPAAAALRALLLANRR